MKKFACCFLGILVSLSANFANSETLKMDEAPLSSKSINKEIKKIDLVIYAFSGKELANEGFEKAGLLNYQRIFSPKLALSLEKNKLEKARAEVGDNSSSLVFELEAMLKENNLLDGNVSINFSSLNRDINLNTSLILTDNKTVIKPLSENSEFMLEAKLYGEEEDQNAFPLLIEIDENFDEVAIKVNEN